MKRLVQLLACSLLITGASCSQDTVSQGANPKKYKAVSTSGPRRTNDKSKFKKHRSPGFGVDLNSRNPYKAKTVPAPKDYKFDKNPGR
ncbi:hypothetical protein [Hymenobacter lucidus]|uniref:Quinol oxidase subunit 4 n=1 Tax=Hymenobacter lucidus TaxID=2880930 RepID=A0ABS8AS15_9BACT|nr:hypothetical protein [Hymenobacter lucidus]MCB2408136.1 hypothetical protein [Hymenobacter lucidus]